MPDNCLLCFDHDLDPITTVRAFTIASRAIVMTAILITGCFRLLKTIKQPTLINVTFLCILVTIEVAVVLKLLYYLFYPMVLLYVIANVLSTFLVLPYLLSQIYLLYQFLPMMKLPKWLPKVLAIICVVLHLSFEGPMYYYHASYHRWNTPIPWYSYVLTLDVLISVGILRTILTSTIAISNTDDANAKTKTNQAKWMVSATIVLDSIGMVLNVMSTFGVGDSVAELFAADDLACIHLIVGTVYLGSLMSWSKQIMKRSSKAGNTTVGAKKAVAAAQTSS